MRPAMRYGGVGLLAGLERVVGRVDSAIGVTPGELVRERIDPLLAQALQLGPAVVGARGVVHAGGRLLSARSW